MLATPRQRVLYEAREIWQKGFVTFDTETTGLEAEDQVIQWAVCSQEGEVLGSGYIKPTVPISSGAFEKHGIREEQLADAPSFADVWPVIRELLTNKIVVIYNANFDIRMSWASARACGIDIPYDFVKDVCAMEIFAQFYGEVHDYYGTYTWQPLNEVAIPHLKIEVQGQPHHAEHDAAATALIIKKLAELADQELPDGWHPPVLVKCAGGCNNVVKECAKADEIWYCDHCGLNQGVFHRCPGCDHVVRVSASGIVCDDLCKYCHQKLYQEMKLLTGAWHYCPRSRYHIQQRVVETSDLHELCELCEQQMEWKRQQEEAEQKRQERLKQERKEYQRAYAKEYRKRQKERQEENRRRAELGLPALEQEQKNARPAETIINHRGHQFQCRKDQHGKSEVFCLKCEATWCNLPHCYCAEIKMYRSWTAIPEHLKTQTQLLKLSLQPAKEQKPEAAMEGSYDRYYLYDRNKCVPSSGIRRSGKEPIVQNEN